MFMCVHMCMWVHTHVYMHVCGGQRTTLLVISRTTVNFVPHRLELTSEARLAVQ